MANYYRAGDNYGMRGHYNYQAGGFPLIGAIARGAAGLLGKGVRAVGTALGIGKKAGTAVGPYIGPAVTAGGKAGKVLKDIAVGAGGAIIGGSLLNGGSPFAGRRSMNHLNPKAAMRATRRIEGFKKKARKILSAVGYTVGPRQGRCAPKRKKC